MLAIASRPVGGVQWWPVCRPAIPSPPPHRVKALSVGIRTCACEPPGLISIDCQRASDVCDPIPDSWPAQASYPAATTCRPRRIDDAVRRGSGVQTGGERRRSPTRHRSGTGVPIRPSCSRPGTCWLRRPRATTSSRAAIVRPNQAVRFATWAVPDRQPVPSSRSSQTLVRCSRFLSRMDPDSRVGRANVKILNGRA